MRERGTNYFSSSYLCLSLSLSIYLSLSLSLLSLSLSLSLSILSFYGNNMGPEGAIALADMLRTNTALTYIKWVVCMERGREKDIEREREGVREGEREELFSLSN